MTYTITSATTKSTRQFNIDPKTFSYTKIKRGAYTGYGIIKIAEKSFQIADPEKAFVDYLYFVALGKKTVNERLNLSSLNKEKITEFAKLYNRPKLNKLIKEQI